MDDARYAVAGSGDPEQTADSRDAAGDGDSGQQPDRRDVAPSGDSGRQIDRRAAAASGDPERQVDRRATARRRATRQRVIRRVFLLLGTHRMDAVMLDVSPYGAQCQLPTASELPLLFILRETEGTARTVALRWMKGDRFGVEFVTNGELDQAEVGGAAPGDMLKKVDALRMNALNDVLRPLHEDAHLGREDVRVAARDVAQSLDRLRRAVAAGLLGRGMG